MILSVDIGLKNLAMCVMTCSNVKNMETYELKLWEVYNILESEDNTNIKCTTKLKNSKECGKKCGYKYILDNAVCYCCKTHFPKHIPFEKNKHTVKNKKVSEYLLQDIARSVLTKVSEIFETNKSIMNQVTKIIIELQPKINNKMKLISHLIYGKFVELFLDKPKTTIRFVRASQKLKAYTGPLVECKLKSAYSKRKFLAVQYTNWFLTNKFNTSCSEWITKFQASSKKDDLSDTFLMAINGLNNVR
jgi:hypothetical protein